jgi:hypothetical protein
MSGTEQCSCNPYSTPVVPCRAHENCVAFIVDYCAGS